MGVEARSRSHREREGGSRGDSLGQTIQQHATANYCEHYFVLGAWSAHHRSVSSSPSSSDTRGLKPKSRSALVEGMIQSYIRKKKEKKVVNIKKHTTSKAAKKKRKR